MNQLKKLLLIDLDDTLADIKSLKWTFNQCLLKLGILNSQTVYEQVKTVLDTKNWLEFYAEKLSETNNINKLIIKKELDKSLLSIKSKPNNIAYLKNFIGTKVVFTYGNKLFQEKKIKLLGLQELIDGVIITSRPKPIEINSYIKDETFIYEGYIYKDVTLLDDKEDILNLVKVKYPWIKIKKAE